MAIIFMEAAPNSETERISILNVDVYISSQEWIYLGIVTLMVLFIFYINKREVAKTFIPLMKDIERIEEELKSN